MKHKITNYFDKIYCINFNKAILRKSFILYQLEQLGWINDVEFFNAIPFSDILTLYIKTANMYENYGNVNLLNTFGCLFSHYSIIKNAYYSGLDNIMIFEDDCNFIKDINKIYDYFDNIPKDWDILFLTPNYSYLNNSVEDYNIISRYINKKQVKFINLNIFETAIFVSSGCLCYKRNAMKIFIDEYEKYIGDYMIHSDQINMIFGNYKESPLNIYTTNGRIVATSRDFYDISYFINNFDGNPFEIPLTQLDINEFFYYKKFISEISRC